MRVRFSLPLKPFSVNAMYYGDGRTKTQAAREWSYKVMHELSQPDIKQKLAMVREAFDPEKHGFALRFTVYYPKEMYFTKKGLISAKTMDITNWEKPLQDLLFDEKYFNVDPPCGCENIRANDKYVVSCNSRKLPGEQLEIKISIAVVDQPKG